MAITQTAEDRLGSLRDHLQDLDLRDRLEDARDRAEHVRTDVVERAEHLRDDVRGRVPEVLEDLEPVARKAKMTGWEAVRRLIGILLILPRLLVRLLGVLPRVVEGAAEQSSDLAHRARDAAGSVPAVRRVRRRRRTQLIAWTVGGFALGAITGWFLGRRQNPEMAYDATHGASDDLSVPHVNGASATVAPDPVVRE